MANIREEFEKEKAKNGYLKDQLELAKMKLEQQQQQYEHKNNELNDIVTSVFLNFREIVKIAERNDYGDPQQKIRQIKEYAEKQKNYYAQRTIEAPYIKNRTTIADQSNK